MWKETMRSSPVGGRTVATSLIAFGIGLAIAAPAVADPGDDPPAPAPAPALPWALPAPPAPGADPAALAPAADASAAAATACKQFNAAMDLSASYYGDFADTIAGGGSAVDYSNPYVQSSNVSGRTALRQAIEVAFSASATPGLGPDISGPMQTWSMHAAQLVAIMGLQGNGDMLDSSANTLNTDARNVQMACAAAGVRIR